MHLIFFLCIFLLTSARGQREGESCVDEYSKTVGKCTVIYSCESATNDFRQNPPTFCSYDAFGDRIVCCLDGSRNAAGTRDDDDETISDKAADLNDGRRISERKCDEYSSSVVEKQDFIPLLTDPQTFSITQANCEKTAVELIIGGKNAKPGEFPHMAAIGWEDSDGSYNFSCGGTLISPRFVVTAAHCTKDLNGQEPVVVRLGDQNIDDNVNDGADPIDVAIRRIHVHPNYRSPKVYNDIALLKLAVKVKFGSGIRPACLWNKNDLEGHQTVIATGWGVTNTSTEESAKELQKVTLSIQNVGFCNRLLRQNRLWSKGLVNSQMCVGELSGGKDTCQGDSGGPIQVVSSENYCIFYIVGVTSFGKNCARRNKPAVYTRMSSYVDWIESVVWPGQ